jgi:hypothetical protein
MEVSQEVDEGYLLRETENFIQSALIKNVLD